MGHGNDGIHTKFNHLHPGKTEMDEPQTNAKTATMSLRHILLTILIAFGACRSTQYEYAFVSNRNNDLDVYVALHKQPLLNITNDKATDYGLAWSPDGEDLVFAKLLNKKYDLFIYHISSQTTEQLTHDTLNQYGPSFAPDGRSILFVSDMDHPQNEIYRMDLSSRNIKRITTNDRLDGSPAFHPDGIRIFYTSFMDKDSSGRITNSEIFVTDTSGTYHTRLTYRIGNDGAVDISPDGQSLTCHYFLNGKADIYTMLLDGTQMVQLTSDTLDHRWPRWSPDGKQIAYTRVSDQSDIWLMHKNGSHKKPWVTSAVRDEILEFRP